MALWHFSGPHATGEGRTGPDGTGCSFYFNTGASIFSCSSWRLKSQSHLACACMKISVPSLLWLLGFFWLLELLFELKDTLKLLWLSCPFTVRGLLARASGLWSQEELGWELGSWCFHMLVFLEWHLTWMVESQKIFHVPGALGSLEYFHCLVLSSQLRVPSPASAPGGRLLFRLSWLPRLVPHLTQNAFLCT